MKKLLSILLILICLDSFGQGSQAFEFNRIYSYALQEDVQKILSVLDTIPDQSLTEEQKDIKGRYLQRFRNQNESMDCNTDDPMLRSLLKLYQIYWRNALLDKQQLKKYDEQLKDSIATFLIAHNYKSDTLTRPEIAASFGQHLKRYLANSGYFSATGKTGNLFDLFVWSKEDTVTYNVKLPETEVKTTVVFLENPVTMGWEEYATFGKYYPGGWATKEQLYSVDKAYDKNSENFKVSYLAHEAQHFADYKTYPNLTGVDLEYRAKLTELILAEETLHKLLTTFISNASSEGRNSHAFANYAVIRDLSKAIYKQDFVSDVQQWKQVEPDKIRKKSKRLLKQHSKSLKKAGADTVTEFIF
ncbi:hypothetical protein [Pontibacter cellulosilyticus]|uniref:DUF4932 domain-containing protein n=1 Tax=Pontibacter cellulosilyticus TaxID=1720253 RepID=A0A923NA58_9BACT|nr:hypothetical protein [Pontibacter cellulosilyticus]MBC5994171.1 hypothetical protein [Pontibacter cellulosilyticus]